MWSWVADLPYMESLNVLELKVNCTKSLQALLLEHQKYLLLNYQLKKYQFYCIYIKSFPNLGANSIQ